MDKGAFPVETNIETVIKEMDDFIISYATQMNKLLSDFEQHKEYRQFIAERLYKLISIPKKEMTSLYKEADNDLRFWLSALLSEFDSNQPFIEDIRKSVVDTTDDNEIPGINILLKKKDPQLGKIIADKLDKLPFQVQNADRLIFYVSTLKEMNYDISDDLKERINNYNQSVDNDWQKIELL